MSETKPAKGEWELSDDQALQLAISRLGVPEAEVRRVEAKWRSLRKKAQDPGVMLGWKY